MQAVDGLSDDKLQEYRDIFSFFDRQGAGTRGGSSGKHSSCDKSVCRDGGGTITTVELGQVMRTFGWTPTEGELRDLIGEVDQDGNGCITFNEFVWLMTR